MRMLTERVRCQIRLSSLSQIHYRTCVVETRYDFFSKKLYRGEAHRFDVATLRKRLSLKRSLCPSTISDWIQTISRLGNYNLLHTDSTRFSGDLSEVSRHLVTHSTDPGTSPLTFNFFVESASVIATCTAEKITKVCMSRRCRNI